MGILEILTIASIGLPLIGSLLVNISQHIKNKKVAEKLQSTGEILKVTESTLKTVVKGVETFKNTNPEVAGKIKSNISHAMEKHEMDTEILKAKVEEVKGNLGSD